MVGSKWSLVDYKRRVSPSATIQAVYDQWDRLIGAGCCFFDSGLGNLGLAVGGQMYDALNFHAVYRLFQPNYFRVHKIYCDKDSPRVWCSAHLNFRISSLIGQIGV